MIQSLIYKFNELQQEAGGIDRGGEEFHAIKELAKRFALSFGEFYYAQQLYLVRIFL